MTSPLLRKTGGRMLGLKRKSPSRRNARGSFETRREDQSARGPQSGVLAPLAISTLLLPSSFAT